MSPSASDPEWELLNAIDPLREPRRAPVLEGTHRENLFASVVASGRETGQSRSGSRAAATRPRALSGARALISDHPRRLLAALGACGTALAVGVVTVTLLLTTGTTAAYAGWTPTPHAISRSQTTKLTSYCRGNAGTMNGHPTGGVFASQPVLTETRGVFTAGIYVTHNRVYSCLYGSRGDASIVHDESSGPVRTAPSPDKIGAPYGIAFAPGDPNGGSGRGGVQKIAPWLAQIDDEMDHSRPGSVRWQRLAEQATRYRHGAGYGFDAYGQAGGEVSAIVFKFSSRRSVTATVQNGWYFAWWPWTSYPNSVQVLTSAGTTTSPMTTTGKGIVELRPTPGCKPGTAGCAFDSSPTHRARH